MVFLSLSHSRGPLIVEHNWGLIGPSKKWAPGEAYRHLAGLNVPVESRKKIHF